MSGQGNKIKMVWSPTHQKNYKRLYNKLIEQSPAWFKIKDEATYLDKINKKELINFIKKLELSDSSKESLFFMVARYYEFNKINNTFITTFKQEGYNLKQRREADDGENELDEKEEVGYMKYNELVAIVENIKYDEIKTRREYMKYLFLKMLLYNPLRTSYYFTALIQQSTKTNDTDNYLILYGQKRARIYINADKVSNTKTFNKEELKNIEIDDRELINLIYESFDKYPRTYLIEIEKNKRLNENYILKLLREATNNKYINIDMVRSAYITHMYNTKNLTYNEKKVIANNLRHTVNTSQLRYLKNLKEDPQNKTDTELIKKMKDLEKENIQVKKQLEEANNKLKSYEAILNKSKEPSKKDIDEDKINEDPKTLRKMRIDYLYKLNVKGIKKPNERLLNLYSITFNNETGKYI